ncbi:MAG: hypothetical protein R3E12_20120 [Candidatus Eisenbacteria bacterium]|uniref:DUF4082 domain-containing protein n=1 Tax=Eiseniibacteriota bacterium TaxID=2212470 RepID=A0A956M3U3_UNCEI|nr:hypothetical protein [Candidatus Eisenbacteria bacterium]
MPYSHRGIVLTLLLGIAQLPTVDTVRARDFVLDQWNDTFVPTLLWNIESFGPLGQQFIPEQSSVGFAEFWIRAPSNGVTARFSVALWTADWRERIGQSTAESVVRDFHGPMRVEFSPPIAVTPGRTYILELRSAPGGIMTAVGPNHYPRGILLRGGPDTDQFDVWFREGIIDPTPTLQASWGSLKARYR